MQNPAEQIERVVQLLTASLSPDVQKLAIMKYYTHDAEFRHPLCTVDSSPHSRDAILGMYQWYRVMSPHVSINIRSVVYNPATLELFLDGTQEFHIRWSPLKPAPSRLIIHLTLRRISSNEFQIASHEDFYHPTDLISLIVPPLVPLVHLALRFGAMVSNINAHVFGSLGYWRPLDTPPSEVNIIHDYYPQNSQEAGDIELTNMTLSTDNSGNRKID